MASRFQRDNARNALFSSYDAQNQQAQPTRSRPSSASPSLYTNNPNHSSPYANDPSHLSAQQGPGFSAYPSAAGERRSGDGGFRPATPNRRGQYSDAVMEELESQNEDQVGEMSRKVRMLKDITVAIGDEIRDSTAFAEKMNEGFEGTRNRLRGTMNRMIRMADKTGIGWRIWLGFFACIFLLFTYVWLF